MKFKVGDKVKLTPNWEDWNISDGIVEEILVIESINETHRYSRGIVTKINFENKALWAEPHEIRYLTPLEELL